MRASNANTVPLKLKAVLGTHVFLAVVKDSGLDSNLIFLIEDGSELQDGQSSTLMVCLQSCVLGAHTDQ